MLINCKIMTEYNAKHTLVLGCGNILFGDDGFGPAVADYIMDNYPLGDDAASVNLGLSTRGFFFDILLSDTRPRRIIVADAVQVEGRKPGEVFELPLDNLTIEKIDDFSFHQGPTSNLLRELRDFCGVEIIIIACQPEHIPDEIMNGLSNPVQKAVIEAGALIYDKYLSPWCF